MKPDYRVGDIVVYHTFNEGEVRRAMVTNKEQDINNGRPGFGAVIIGPHPGVPLSVWGYDELWT